MTATRTLGAMLTDAAATTRGVTAIEHDARSVSLPYRDLLPDALAIGAGLHASGLSPGDRVALVIPEVGNFIRAFFSVSAAGLVPVPLCPPGQAIDLATFARQSRHILVASRAAAVITSGDVVPLLDLSDITPPPELLITEALSVAAPLTEPVPVPLSHAALLQFTSGSTAAPKGVVLSHGSIAANLAAITGPHGLDVTATDVGVSWLPLYHDMGLIGMLLSAVSLGADVVVMSPVLFLKRPSAWLDAISRYRATVSFAPTFAYDLCRRRVKPSQIDTLDLSCWRVAGCGAEPIRPDALRAFAEHFARAGFRMSSFRASYGLAEHSLAVSFSRPGLNVDTVDAERLVRDSVAAPVVNGSPAVTLVGCGHAFPDHQLEIVDDEGRELPDRHIGTIVVRGPSVMDGYYEDPTTTATTLKDGCLYTGDLGYTADGELYVCGRTKDLIIRQGRKYHPPDLESAIADLNAVPLSGVVVFGINHVEEPEEVVAVLEARATARVDDLVDQVKRRVRETAGLELDRVVVGPPGTIPRTTSGKVRRAETRARFQAGTLLAGRER